MRVRATAKISIGTLLAILAAALLTATPSLAATGGAGVPTSAGKAAAKKKPKAKKKAKAKKDTTAEPKSDDDAGQPASGGAQSGGATAGVTAPAATTGDQPTVAGTVAKIVKGVAYAPALAPDAVKQAIWTANEIIGRPYVYGGGHASFTSKGYDCSGTVSYALHGGDLLDSPLDSGSFMKWGESGRGDWITIFTNPGHAYVVIAGIRLDTSAADDPAGGKGPRWRPLRGSNAGFTVRHPSGL
jgi:hypothetical protein